MKYVRAGQVLSLQISLSCASLYRCSVLSSCIRQAMPVAPRRNASHLLVQSPQRLNQKLQLHKRHILSHSSLRDYAERCCWLPVVTQQLSAVVHAIAHQYALQMSCCLSQQCNCCACCQSRHRRDLLTHDCSLRPYHDTQPRQFLQSLVFMHMTGELSDIRKEGRPCAAISFG